MKLAPVLAALFAFATVSTVAAEKDPRVFEMRTYTALPGRLDALNARFRDHTCKLFEKHGMVNLGYFVPVQNTNNQLIYFLAHQSRDAARKSWAAFIADPDWRKAQQASEADGKILAKAPEALFLDATDYSPAIKHSDVGGRVFEMRTYTTEPGRLDALNARFRDHTVKLFAKHGMANIAYWVPMKGEKGADNTLVYLLAHKSEEAAKASFDGFRKDGEWVAARKASEEKAGGSLTVQGGVKSVFLKPVDYSRVK